VTPAQDDLATADWASLACDHNIDLVVCIASALKRGVINEDEASRYDKPAANMSPAYHLSGLGQLLDAILESDRVISFGP
jgi:tRNA 2-thiouridine synthesizing protein D